MRLYCGNVTKAYEGQVVTVNGWIDRNRNLGGMCFLSLRDREGIVQVFIKPEAEFFDRVSRLHPESCIKVVGKVIARPEGQVNPEMKTGEIEIEALEVEVYSEADVMPLDYNTDVPEELRLKYRYLDLRRPDVQRRFMVRHKAMQVTRAYLVENGFLEIETPFLCKATPEGARDYLVPSRVNKGKFYALPQSPQIYKQLLMASGFDRYFQIVKCFRDEDLRADRQPEFTQIDLETSFLDGQQVRDIAEGLARRLWKEILNYDLPKFPMMSYDDAMRDYGSDKPDLRNPLLLKDVNAAFAQVELEFLRVSANDAKSRVIAIKVPGASANISRKRIDEYTKQMNSLGLGGLAHFSVVDKASANVKGSIAKFITPEIFAQLDATLELANDDIVFVIADKKDLATKAAGALRIRLGRDEGLVDFNSFAPLWVVNFPMYEIDEESGALIAAHHPFTSPLEGTVEYLENTPVLDIRADACDMVINGFECTSGSVRIYKQDLQAKIFELIGIDHDEQRDKFGYLLDAFKYGAPPHAGCAFGFDRIAMLLTGTENIRDVVAFPKNNQAQCLMTDSPSYAADKALEEVAIDVVPKYKVHRDK
ncbi:aspartate--tRNA ligase [Psittacicella hinzii]|uniref:Aspartate--tRNA(Asp/Asn) ligase n=1 Tax=Psittacicella hinzii TaxID=2028575 RepID=A0A3A1YKV5_9GAMM|nr:aspartate--tRNA ligase [Psittacicella hinzii]RIY38812.1 aspartate--tRNA ligase [Psittacicella hinzii]